MSSSSLLRGIGLLAFLGVVLPISVYAQESKSKKKVYRERFDTEVREDLFAGFQGNQKALQKGLDSCNKMLEKDPEHAEAMVWRGAARIFLSGEAFQEGDSKKGMSLWADGLADVDKAKELEPDNIGVLIPRAAVLLPAGKSSPPVMGLPLLKRVQNDLETAYKKQEKVLDKIGEHPLGELRMGLADVYRALKKSDKSKQQLEAVLKDLPGTEYAEQAKKWLAAPAEKQLSRNCIGCHSS